MEIPLVVLCNNISILFIYVPHMDHHPSARAELTHRHPSLSAL